MGDITTIEQVAISIGVFILGSGGLLWYVRKKRYRGKTAFRRKVGDIFFALLFMGVGILFLTHDSASGDFLVIKDWKLLALAIVEGIIALWVIQFAFFHKKK